MDSDKEEIDVGGEGEEEVESRRKRKLTKKGIQYAIETKGKRLRNIFRQLEREYEHINMVIATGVLSKDTIEDVRREYASWLVHYNTLYEVREEYAALLIEPEISEFKEESIQQDQILLNIKSTIEQYFLKFGSVQGEREGSTHRRSQGGRTPSSYKSGISSLATSISSAQLKEKQRQAELLARARVLKEKQRLEQAKLDIKMKEEELDLRTQIEISEAKSKVLDNFDTNQDDKGGDREDLENVENIVVKREHDQHSEKVVVKDVSQQKRKDEEVPVESNISSFVSSGNVLGQDTITAVVQQLRKPRPDIQKFSGNPLEFQKFMRQFRTKIVSNTDSEDELMCYLEQFTEGEAHKVVKGYSYLDARNGYQAALNELEERYGNQDKIANALIQRAMCWSNIKPDDAKALDEYAIFLNECQNAVRSLHAVKVLEYPDNVRKLVMKLPFHCHEKWRNVVLQVRLSGMTVGFSDLVKFVRKEAQKATDPMYGKDAMRHEDKKQPFNKRFPTNQQSSKTKLSFSTDLVKTNNERDGQQKSSKADSKQSGQATSVRNSCDYCGDERHKIGSCEKLLSKPHGNRLDFLRSKGLCFRCLEHGHRSKECVKTVTCRLCKGNHSTLLHMDQSSTNLKCLSSCTMWADEVTDCMEAGDGSGECTLAVVPVKVSFKDAVKVVSTYAFLDPGSTVSFCSQTLMDKLGCYGKSKKVEITIDTMGKPYTTSVHSVSGLKVHDLDLIHTVVLPTVYSRTDIPVTRRHIPTNSDIEKWPHLEGIHLSSLDSDVELLIGGNVPDAYSPQEVKVGPQGSPHATKTRLGWTLWNVVRSSPLQASNGSFACMKTDVINVRHLEEVKELNNLVAKSMNFDFPESAIDDKAEMSREDQCFLNMVNQSIYLQDGHYYINLPFKDPDFLMPNNSEQALKRLNGLKQKFKNNSQFQHDYKAFMEDIISKGYAEKVPMGEVKGQVGRTWFIPHHGVYHPRKPTKIRVVFDCTASYQGVSLNSMLLQGPNLTNSLLGILLRFRQEPVAFMGDVESMYYRVRVPIEDCDYLRFYWWPEGDCEKKPDVYRMLVHLFGAISSASCATFALQRTAEDNRQRYDPDVVSMVTDNFYVDDCLASVDKEERAVSVIHELSTLCKEGGFRLTKWVSNSRTVMTAVPVDERAKDVKQLNLECESLPSERALGVFWFVDSDSLGFKIQDRSNTNTRRGILSVVSSVYDPLGLVAPYVLVAKQLLQELCKKGLAWDDAIDEFSLKVWIQWLKDLPKLELINVERCYKPQGFGKIASCQLHLFSDASDVGYGVVAYLRLTNHKDVVHCVLVMAKSRVAPLKKTTTPRMELTAATVAVRLCRVIARELQYQICETFYWTDSMSVLRYIANSTSRFKTFVANRVATIQEGSEVKQWNYVDTKSNPADCASRGMNFDKFKNTRHWFEGPIFLWKSREEWPTSPDQSCTLSNEDQEVKKSVSCMIVQQAKNVMDMLLNHYSSWMRLKRAVGWIILITRELKRKVKETCRKGDVSKEACTKPILTVTVLKDAETALLCYVQGQHFEKELNVLRNEECHRKGINKASPLSKLNPFLDNGIIRVGGRLERAKLQHDSKHPIVLPRRCLLSRLITEDAHKAVGHMGRNAILTQLRQRYWILGASSIIKSLVSKCVICLKYQSRVGEQQMADLPQDRLQSDKPPFSHVGVDYFGPFLVKRGRATVKRYGVVFSCLTMRAVHLEVACSLNTDSCLNAIRRFIARRGSPEVFRSDNGTNFTSSERELKEEISKLNQVKLHSSLLNKGIDWTFNPPAASHHGGIWERMIRLIRKVLNSVMKEQGVRLDDEELSTLFCEVEMILNGRPITDVPYDPYDLNPLTPNHLLLLHAGERMPPGVFSKDDVYTRRRWRQVQYLADLFWKRWMREYLPLQQERQKWVMKKRNLQIGDIVLLADSTPRNAWSLGRITEVMADKKGFVRVARVKTATTELVRPVDKLCVIVAVE